MATTRFQKGDAASATLVHILLIVFAIVSIAPILLIIVNSLKTTIGIFTGPFALPSAETFNLQGYINVFTRGNFVLNYTNSVVVTVATIALTIVLGTLAAFALVEYQVRISPVLTGFFIIGIMLPIRLGTVPLIKQMIGLHLIDSLLALILVYTAMQLPLAIALMMTYFRSVPTELKEAARMDGAREFRVLGITLPLVRPGLAAVASITMLPVWNDLWFPLILAPGERTKTIVLGASAFLGQFVNDYNAVLAALTLAIVPVVVLYVIFSRQLVSGITGGALKLARSR